MNTSVLRLAEDTFVVPAWFPQQKTWLEDPRHSDNAIFNYPLLVRLRGPLNEAALERSLHEITRRHEVLRSVFRITDGELVQVVLAAQGPVLEKMDTRGFPETRVWELAVEEARRPFDLSREFLFRARLMRLGPDDHFLQLTSHFLVYDDWSSGILAHELAELYRAFAAGETSPLPDIAYQYRDYVRWQQGQLQGKELESRLAYWNQQIHSATGFQHLPTDFPRPARSINRGARESAVLPAELADSLGRLSRQERVSLFMVLVAGFQCLLHHYSGDDEIVIASCVANRPLVEVERLIGRFGNQILLRTSLRGNPTFRELLKRVRESTLGAYTYQDLPYGCLVKEDRGPLFQVMFILQNAPKENRHLPGLTMKWVPLYEGTAKFDLIVWLKIEPALEVILEYDRDLFLAQTMKRIVDDYRAILAAAVNDPTMGVSRKPESLAAPPTGTMTTARPKENVSANDDVQSRLVALWEEAFDTRPIGVHENFFELGGDSLMASRLFARMEKVFQKKLPLAALLEAPTIEELARVLSGANGRSFSSSLVVIQPNGSRPRFFTVHGHMGEVFYCRNLSRSLGADFPVYGLRSQIIDGVPAHYTVEEMAGHYVEEIRAVQARGPYFLGGFCGGGMVAYEMARRFEARGEEVALLALFNTPAPGSLDRWPLRQRYLSNRVPNELRKLAALGFRDMRATLSRKAAGFARLVFGSFKTSVWRMCSRCSLAGAEKWSQGVLTVGDINVAAAKAYRPGGYAGRITLFLTEEAAFLYDVDPKEGWTALAEEGIEFHAAGGDNNTMFDERFVDALAEQLKSCIQQAQTGSHLKCRKVTAPAPPRPLR